MATVARPSGQQEEVVLGKAYDLALLRRLWPFVRPHWKLLLAWAMFMPLTIAFELAQPALFRYALTEHMLHSGGAGKIGGGPDRGAGVLVVVAVGRRGGGAGGGGGGGRGGGGGGGAGGGGGRKRATRRARR